MSLANQIIKDRGQPSTVRIGTVTQVSPLEVTVQATPYRNVGILGDYSPFLGDIVALLGQSAVSADGSSWLTLGKVQSGDLPTTHLGAIGRGLRTTSSTGTTTEIGVLRIDDIPIFEGRLYRVALATSCIYSSTVANDLLEGRLYYSLTGAAVAGVNIFGTLSIETRSAAGAQYTDGTSAFLPSPVAAGDGTGTLSVLFAVARTAGTGTVSIQASATYPVHMVVEDMGTDPGDTGVDI